MDEDAQRAEVAARTERAMAAGIHPGDIAIAGELLLTLTQSLQMNVLPIEEKGVYAMVLGMLFMHELHVQDASAARGIAETYRHMLEIGESMDFLTSELIPTYLDKRAEFRVGLGHEAVDLS